MGQAREMYAQADVDQAAGWRWMHVQLQSHDLAKRLKLPIDRPVD